MRQGGRASGPKEYDYNREVSTAITSHASNK